jgi:hypothetical protein
MTTRRRIIAGAVGALALPRTSAAAERYIVVNAHHTN